MIFGNPFGAAIPGDAWLSWWLSQGFGQLKRSPLDPERGASFGWGDPGGFRPFGSNSREDGGRAP